MKSQRNLFVRVVRHSFSGAIAAGTVTLTVASAPAQNLFVSSGENIVEITPSGTQSIFASVGAHADGLAFDSAGDLFATVNYLSNSAYVGNIIEITPGGVKSTFATGSHNSDFGPLAFNSSGNLFVSVGNEGILEYTPQGVPNVFDPAGPEGLAFDSFGNLFGSGGTTISKWTPGGTRSNFAPGGSNPAGLAFNSQGDLFAVATDGHIYEYSPGGVKSTFVFLPSVLYGLAFNSEGDLFVTNPNDGAITEITPGGAHSTFTSGLGDPIAIAFQGVTLPVPEPSALGFLVVSAVALIVRHRSHQCQ